MIELIVGYGVIVVVVAALVVLFVRVVRIRAVVVKGRSRENLSEDDFDELLSDAGEQRDEENDG
jgi:hypothetical protein